MRLILLRSLLIFYCLMSYSNSSTANYQVSYPEKLQQQLSSALKAKGSDYKARTHHFSNRHPTYTNRLILTDSPYLIQHAHNPVNWYPWGEEPFAIAKRENKPIFLSIGYATCHWCHVMEEESFESIKVAKILNKYFISIKVDREQHPDIDATYMTAVTLLNGQGGWPMSSFITAEGKPFFGGSYYPQAEFITLLQQVKTAWVERHQSILSSANLLAEAVKRETSSQHSVTSLEQSTVQSAIQTLLSRYDNQNGGFSLAPKFPNEPSLLLLLQNAERNNDSQLSGVLEKTLSAMAEGGFYDQIGGGFHRYSTDEKWLVPHFEKMLYNQAYLARVYAQAYRLTQNPSYALIAKQTLDYVISEMSSPKGLFYSATDADSEGEEGTFFVWTIKQIKQLLNAADAKFIINLYGLTETGNFEGKNIFFLPQSLQQLAKQQGLSFTTLMHRISPLIETLKNHRNTRSHPLTDNKVIVSWNSMFITALAEVGDILNEAKYINTAKAAAIALWNSQRESEGLLWRINLDNQPSIMAKQEDYAHFSEALITLYDVTNEISYLQMAEELSNEMISLFMNSASGTLSMGKDPLLFTQPKDAYDSALPSGNSVAVRVFNRLFKRTGKQQFNDLATKILQALSSNITRQPTAYTYMLAQLDELKKGEISSHQYAARGAIKVDAKVNNNKLLLQFTIKPGWHINAHVPLQKQLIATDITVLNKQHWQLSDIQYPPAELVNTNFDKQSLALYQGEFTISAKLTPLSVLKSEAVKINLNLQACNQNSCLAPELLTFFVNPVKKN